MVIAHAAADPALPQKRARSALVSANFLWINYADGSVADALSSMQVRSPVGRGLGVRLTLYRQAVTPHPDCCAIRPLPTGEAENNRATADAPHAARTGRSR